MFIEFLYELRSRGVKVGTQEALALADALFANLHECSLDGFYYVARALLIHSESQLDEFDVVFKKHFEGIAIDALWEARVTLACSGLTILARTGQTSGRILLFRRRGSKHLLAEVYER